MGSRNLLYKVTALAVLSALPPAQAEDFADVIPSIGETQEMAVLSRLVYKFRYRQNFTCDNFPEQKDNDAKDLDCQSIH